MYNGKETKAIEQVQLKYLKLMLGVSRHTSSPGVYGETGQFPIFILQKIMTLKYWCHILNSSSCSPLRHCYKSLIHFDRSGKVNWVTHVKQLLCSIGLQDTWREQRIENSKRFMKDIEITIKNDYVNIWRQATTSAPKLRTYITFKKSFNIEHYLLFLTNIKDITDMAKLRLSSHCLRIETGRHENLPKKDRICLRCESEIDDEVHFLITSSYFNTERTLFFSNINLFISNFHGETPEIFFILLLNSNNSTVLNMLAKYIKLCFNKIT